MNETSDKKPNFDNNDPFTSGMIFWQKYISNLFSVYNQFISDTQRMNQIYHDTAELTKEIGSLYNELAIRIEKINKLYQESATITERMNKYWLENIWKPFLLFKEKNEAEEKRRKE
jgi:hypothetical protein